VAASRTDCGNRANAAVDPRAPGFLSAGSGNADGCVDVATSLPTRGSLDNDCGGAANAVCAVADAFGGGAAAGSGCAAAESRTATGAKGAPVFGSHPIVLGSTKLELVRSCTFPR
jgi:hypothetical protein